MLSHEQRTRGLKPSVIPPKVGKATMRKGSDIFGQITNDIISYKIFPKKWIEANLVLLEKPRIGEENTMVYKPICLLNVFTKKQG